MSSSDQIPIPISISISISIPNLIPIQSLPLTPIPRPVDNETDDFNGFHDAKM